MNPKRMLNELIMIMVMVFLKITTALAADSSETEDVIKATNDFSSKMLTIFKGPIVKILAGIVLFVGVAGLLRGKHSVAVSCGVAFILLLFLPIILQYFGG